MTFPPDPLVQIQNNFMELFLMMASTKNAQTEFAQLNTGVARALDIKCLYMTSSTEPLVQI